MSKKRSYQDYNCAEATAPDTTVANTTVANTAVANTTAANTTAANTGTTSAKKWKKNMTIATSFPLNYVPQVEMTRVGDSNLMNLGETLEGFSLTSAEAERKHD
jgi:hypothetical protein